MEDRYRFIRLLGQGAMGEVYLAEHTALGRREAVKILRPELATDPQFIAAFRREARATNRVQHPNIVGVYDFGRLADGRFYLAMEYAEGVPLDQLLVRQGKMPVARAVPILSQLTDAVGCAHAHGVVHRDLKPGNLILCEHRGQGDWVKVLDFGMAKILDPRSSDGPPLSRAGTIMGTPTYMAPEHLIGRNVDERADLYAIGCIAYEMLVGRPPFVGSRMEVADAHISRKPPPVRASVPDVPPGLDELVLRCLEKSPAQRPGSAYELKQELDRVHAPRGKGSSSRLANAPTQRSLTPMHSDFENADTGVGDWVTRLPPRPAEPVPDVPRTERQLKPITHPSAPTIDPGQIHADYDEIHEINHLRAMLLRAAEALLDRGHSHPELVLAVVEVREAEQDRIKFEHELAEIERQLDDVEQDAREREAALRFALSDLEFGAPTARSDEPTAREAIDLRPRVKHISEKLARIAQQRDQDIGRLTERSVTLTAELAKLEEHLAILYDRLDDSVNRGISRHTGKE
jgi:serine/threonine protein kinase